MKNQHAMDDEYLLLMSLYFMVVDSRRGQKINEQNEWLFETDVLAAKLFKHVGTIRYLRSGTVLVLPGDQPRVYVDHSSISVIARAAFETYLAFYFLYCDQGCSIEEKKFRYSIWKLRGFLDRQNFKTVREENLHILEEERKVMTKLLSNIESNTVFKQLSAKDQGLSKKGKWRLKLSWAELAEIAGFNKGIFEDVYSHLCSYAHSGRLSALQIGQAINISEQHQLSTISMQYAMILMSHLVKSYSDLFPDTKIVIESKPDLAVLSDKWYITWNEEGFLRPFSHNPSLKRTSNQE
jgi:Family of unknown function (DUF5677)